MYWLVVGVSGVTCSGKSTLATSLLSCLSNSLEDTANPAERRILQVRLVRQDDYFYKRDSPQHTWIPEMNYINREIISALDMPRMISDVESIIHGSCSDHPFDATVNILLIEGFLIFNHPKLLSLCDVRIEVQITQTICRERRKLRTYNPPNPPGYFETFIWPLYEKHSAEYRRDVTDLIVVNGEWQRERCLQMAIRSIYAVLLEKML